MMWGKSHQKGNFLKYMYEFLSYTDTPFVVMKGQETIFCIPTSPKSVAASSFGIMLGNFVIHSLFLIVFYVLIVRTLIFDLLLLHIIVRFLHPSPSIR